MYIENNNVVLWKSSNIKSFYFDFSFKSKEDFLEVVLNTWDPGFTYSVLVRIEYNNGHYCMLGNQIAFYLKDNKDMDPIINLYDLIKQRLDSLYSYCDIESIDSVQVLFVIVNVLPKLKLNNVNKVNLPQKIGFNIKDIKAKYNSNILPLTVNTNYFGKLILDN